MPVYNQLDLCRQCLASLEAQTFRDFKIILVDDGGTQDYQGLIGEFSNLKIGYNRNDKNLGAINNIFNTIFFPVQSDYVMSMHEDDLLHPEYLKIAVANLVANPQSVFIGSNCIFFDRRQDIDALVTLKPSSTSVEYAVPDFVRFLLQDNPFMLASVIYRSEVLKTAKQPDLKELSIACDRPFLIDLMKFRTCLILDEPLFFSRRHGKKDMRGRDLSWQQAFGLFEYYRNHLPQPLSLSDTKIFLIGATNNLLLTYRSLFLDRRSSRLNYIMEGERRGLIKFRYLNSKGCFGLLSMCLGSCLSFFLLNLVQKSRQFFKPSRFYV